MEGYDGLNIIKKKDGSSHPAVEAIRNLHTLLRTHTKTVKLPLKIEQLGTLGSFHESLIPPRSDLNDCTLK